MISRVCIDIITVPWNLQEKSRGHLATQCRQMQLYLLIIECVLGMTEQLPLSHDVLQVLVHCKLLTLIGFLPGIIDDTNDYL